MKQAWSTAVVLSLSLCGVAVAQSSGDTAAAIDACARIGDQAARLECFDKLARQTPARAEDTASAAPLDSDAARRSADPPSTAVATAPASAPAASSASRRDVRAAERAQNEHVSTVTALREIQPGRVEVTLANGEVWRQTHSDRYNLLLGHEVKLYPSGFGQYFRLSSTELRGFIQVERVK